MRTQKEDMEQEIDRHISERKPDMRGKNGQPMTDSELEAIGADVPKVPEKD